MKQERKALRLEALKEYSYQKLSFFWKNAYVKI